MPLFFTSSSSAIMETAISAGTERAIIPRYLYGLERQKRSASPSALTALCFHLHIRCMKLTVEEFYHKPHERHEPVICQLFIFRGGS